jgi:hypothetical protein
MWIHGVSLREDLGSSAVLQPALEAGRKFPARAKATRSSRRSHAYGWSCGWVKWAILLLGLLPGWLPAANPALAGRWRLDVAQSTALDGWTAMDLVVRLDGSKVELRHDMTWRSTKVTGINVVDTAVPVAVPNFFRVDQRHMAVYAQPKKSAATTAAWIDDGRTLRVEAQVPLEVSQGEAIMRVYSEYRVLEGGQGLVLLELHSTRTRPLVYRFTKVPEEAEKTR